MKVHFMVFCVLTKLVVSQRSSPCPGTLSYESKGNEDDRWYGVISLKSDEDLTGVWLRITLDRPAELIGNWFGEASSSDNIDYLIRNSNYKLEAGPPVSVRFFVKYDPSRSAPNIESIKLNGRTICSNKKNEGDLGPTTPTLHISQLRPTGSGSNQNSRPSSSSAGNSRPSNSGSGSSSSNSRPSSSSSSNNNEKRTTSSSSNSRPSSSSSNKPSSSSNSNSNSNRPSSSNTSRPSSSSANSNTNSRPSSNARPSYSSESVEDTSRPSYSNSGSSSSNNDNVYFEDNRRPSNGNSGTSLSVDEDDSENGDFFQGDFVSILQSNQKKPSNTQQVSSKSSSCGTVAARAAPLISHGQDTWPGQWPWHAALYHSKGIQLMYTCGATLITEQHVVTAAHCVTKPQTNRPVNPSNILIYLGKYNLISFGPEVQDRGIADIQIHPDYNHSVFFNDVAVLKLSRPVAVTNFVRPCCLWDGESNLENIIRQEGTVVGWGFDENRKLSSKLMEAKMPIVSNIDCVYSNRDFYSRFTFEKNYCAGFRNGTSVCNGDSGGGMVFPRKNSNGQTVWQLRGLVSVGVALQGQGICDTSQYIVFTDVAKHSHWIRQVIAD